MVDIIYLLLLLLVVAISAGGILLSLRMKKRVGEPYWSSFMLFLVFISVYGLYSVWGTGFIRYVIIPIEKSDITLNISRFLGFLGLPFLLTGWYLLLRLMMEISMIKLETPVLLLIMLAALALIVLSGIFIFPLPDFLPVSGSPILILALINLAFYFYSGIGLIFTRQEDTHWKTSRPVFWLGFGVIVCGLMQSSAMVFNGNNYITDALLLLIYFAAMLLPLFILWYSPLVRKKLQEEESKGFKAFCRKYGISPREAEVIQEICSGKANKEIAESLFITLQTVKDHIHNIFVKTDVKSRVQLANMVREKEN